VSYIYSTASLSACSTASLNIARTDPGLDLGLSGTHKSPPPINCHTFRATDITAYLLNDASLEEAQIMAAHESPKTTNLYDQSQDEGMLDKVKRILLR
jgi:hypothetical protein